MSKQTVPYDTATNTASLQNGRVTATASRGNNRVASDARNFADKLTPPDSGEGFSFGDETLTPQSNDDTAKSAIGRLKINGTETNYVGSAHWASILDSISSLKSELENDSDHGADSEPELDEWQHEDGLGTNSKSISNVGSLLRSPARLDKAQLLAAVPPKHVVDQLVAAWFNSHDPFKSIIHKIQFENEYRQFWEDPSKTPVMWLGLLYAILSLGSLVRLQMSSHLISPLASSNGAEEDRYHELSAAAMVLADYTTPKPFTIECLLLYTGAWRIKAAALDVWLLLGVAIRLALSMGYHREASHYGTLSPYACEMRRRVYGVLYLADALSSFQLGLPAMLRSVQSDTGLPQNLLDHDFGIHTKIMSTLR